MNMGQIAYFSMRMRKAALFLLPVKNLFPDPDFLSDAGILAIRKHFRQILRFMDFHDLGVIFRGKTWELVG